MARKTISPKGNWNQARSWRTYAGITTARESDRSRSNGTTCRRTRSRRCEERSTARRSGASASRRSDADCLEISRQERQDAKSAKGAKGREELNPLKFFL